jgi:hypothetical protein
MSSNKHKLLNLLKKFTYFINLIKSGICLTGLRNYIGRRNVPSFVKKSFKEQIVSYYIEL